MSVLVTGANGHVGYALTKHLVENGYQVRASIRNASDPARRGRLEALGAEVVEADLLDPDTLARAAAGMEGVFQAAATYELIPKNSAESVIRASVEGGINMLRAAKAAGVRRVVFTSSCVAIGPVRRGTSTRDESHWNELLEVPYYRAKTEAEKRAWDFAAESGLDLVTVLPGVVGGPLFVRPTPSIELIQNIRLGMFRMGVMRSNLPYVDVRDVAEAHRIAFETQNASGRYIIANDVQPDFVEIVEAMRKIDPRTPKAGPAFPDWTLTFMPFLDWLGHLTMGTARMMTLELTSTVKGRVWSLTNARARMNLGWAPRIGLEQSLQDMIREIDAQRSAA
jgi:dihydroflavonol-4-reductase